MRKSVRAMWREYFDFERDIFKLFKEPGENGIHVIDQIPGMEPEYKVEYRKKGTPVYHPPRHIRYIAWMETIGEHGNMYQEFKGMVHSKPGAAGQQPKDGDLKELYKKIKQSVGEEYKRMPLRTPVFRENIIKIGHSSYPAYYSKRITGDKFRIALKSMNKFKGKSNAEIITIATKYMEQLNQIGVDCEFNEDDIGLTISGNDILKYAGSKHVQLRMATGMQRKLRLVSSDPKVSDEWIPYRFLILNQPCAFYQVNQRQTTMRIEHDAKQIPLPFLHKDIKFWDTTKRINRLR